MDFLVSFIFALVCSFVIANLYYKIRRLEKNKKNIEMLLLHFSSLIDNVNANHETFLKIIEKHQEILTAMSSDNEKNKKMFSEFQFSVMKSVAALSSHLKLLQQKILGNSLTSPSSKNEKLKPN